MTSAARRNSTAKPTPPPDPLAPETPDAPEDEEPVGEPWQGNELVALDPFVERPSPSATRVSRSFVDVPPPICKRSRPPDTMGAVAMTPSSSMPVAPLGKG